MDAMHRKAIKIISLFIAVAFLILLPVITAEAANDIASSYQVNSTAVELTATWTEYANIGGFATGIGNTTVTITVNTATNFSTARSYGRIKRDGIVIESFNLSQSTYPETVTYIAPMSETEATHNYTFESYCTAGKKCSLYNRTFSATFIKTGSFAASVTNVTGTSPITSTYGATPNIACPTCVTNTTAQITRTQVTGQEEVDTGQNTSITNIESTNVNQNTSITNIETVNTDQNTSITNIQSVNIAQNTSISSINTSTALNDSYRQSNDTDIRAAMNTMNTSTAANRTEAQNMANSINTTLTAMNSSSAANATTSQNMANSINTTLTAMNSSTAANYTTAQNMANSINSTKANKTNISEFTGGTIADILFFFSLNGTNATALAANTTANNTNATLTTHTAATGTAVHGLGNMSTQNKTAVDITGGNISGINAWTTLNNTVSPNVSMVRNLTTDNVTEGSINQYFTNARVYTVGNVTYLKLDNTTTCTGTTNKTTFNGTWFTCETDQTSSFTLNAVVSGVVKPGISGAAMLLEGSGITLSQTSGNITITSVAASVTNDTVNPYNLNGSNVTSGLINYSYLKNVTVNLTSAADVSGLLPDANLASTFVKTVGATTPCTSTGGQNPSITCVGLVTNETVNPYSFNASNATGVLPKASMPANVTYNNSAYIRVSKTDQLNLVDSTETRILYDTEQVDRNGDFNAFNFTAPVTGDYFSCANVEFSQLVASKHYTISIFKNNVHYSHSSFGSGADVSGVNAYASSEVCDLIPLIKNDNLSVFVASYSGTNTVDIDTSYFFVRRED